MSDSPCQLEVCVDSVEGCRIATEAGATRIELSIDLDLDGLTPPVQLVEACLAITHLPLIALVRCRPGDFCYTEMELELMRVQCTELASTGISGLAIGALLANDEKSNVSLHFPFLSSIAEEFGRLELVVHRAFDRCTSPVESLAKLKSLGFKRVLTSGGPASALDGLEALRAWQATREIEILPAGGVAPSNARKILKTTLCSQLHGSFRPKNCLLSQYKNPKLPDGEAIAGTLQILQEQLNGQK